MSDFFLAVGKQPLGTEYKDKVCAVETTASALSGYSTTYYHHRVLVNADAHPEIEFDENGIPLSDEPEGCIDLEDYTSTPDKTTGLEGQIADLDARVTALEEE